MVLASAGAGALLYGAFRVRSFGSPLAVALLWGSAAAVMLTSACAGGLMGEVVEEERKARVSAWFQGGSLSGGARGGGGLLVLAEHWSRQRVGVLAAAMVVVPSVAAQWIAERPVERSSDGLRGRLRAMGWEFRRTFLRWETVAPLLVLAAPFGSGAALSLLPSVAVDYGVTGAEVAWINGLLGGCLTAGGAMAMTLLPKGTDARVGYPVAGLLNAASLAVMVLGPPRPLTYMVGAGLFLLTVGAAYALFTALVLQVMGEAGKSGGTRYSMLVSVGNAPVAYMAWVDGRGYERFGTKGLAGTDAVVSGVTAMCFLAWFLWWRRRDRARSAALAASG